MKKKKVTALLSLITALTLTACTFQFKAAENTADVIDSVKNIRVEFAEDIAEKIDSADLTDGDDLEELAESITAWAENTADENESLATFEKATLVRVVDGDTIVVEIDNEQYKVRLIGVDTPESVASQEYLDRTGKENTEEGKSASEYTKDILADYDTVYLQSDTSDTDRYGRLLRYVWLEVPEDDFDLGEISTKMLNGILVYHGVANVATYKPDTAHQADFEYLFDHQGEELE